MVNKVLDTFRRRIKPVLALISASTLIFSVYSLITGKDLTSIFAALSSSCSLIVMIFLSRLKNKTISKTAVSGKIDEELVLSILHMYVVSQGDVGPDQLVSSVAKMKEYGYYSRVFSKIREIAKDFGYGFAKAMTHMAELVKAPLKDILIRCTEALSTPEPKEYLELENSTLFEEYSGHYLRSIESIKTLGGVYGTFQSVSVFIVMTLDIMSTFINIPNIVYYSYVISAVAIMVMFLGFKAVIPKEKLVYIDGDNPPRLYRIFKLSMLVALSLAVPAALIGASISPPYGFIIFGASIILPGLLAYRFESFIIMIDNYYPTFIKALCENMASTSSIKSALSYVLHMELGPLKGLVKRALARLMFGIKMEKSIDLLSLESASYHIYTMNRMLLDAVNYGGDLIEVGKILGDSSIKFLEFRKRRSYVAKSFKTVIFILHPVTVALLVILTYLCRFFSQSMVSLPYFSFGEIPISAIHIGNILMILFLTTLNAMALREAESRFWGTSLLYIGLLLILSGVSWLIGEKLMDIMFGQTLKGFEKLFA